MAAEGTAAVGSGILLLEFVNDDIFNQHRAEAFPFLQGYLKARGVPVAWLAMAAGAAARADAPWMIEPGADARALLVDAVRSVRPSWVIANEVPGPGLAAALADAVPGVSVVPPDARLLRHGLIAALHAHLGCRLADGPAPDPGDSLYHQACPDYAARLVGDAPAGPPHLVPLIAGPTCVYRRSLVRNPHFAGVSLDGVVHARGCTFCVNPDGPPPRGIGRDPVASALMQIRRFHETAPGFRRTNRYLVRGIRVFRQLPRFLGEVLAMGLPASEFFFSCRVDELLAQAEALRAWVPRVAAAGHAMHLWNVGLENFSPVENGRFNKGVSPRQADEALALLDGLESAHPAAIGFRRHGGFGLILFTPWTRLDDLEINIRALRRHGDRGDLGPVASRLQLRDGTPLEVLARRDGLVDDDGGLAAVPRERSCLTEPGDRELPWRFANPEVAAVWSVLAGWFVREAGKDAGPVPPASALDVLEALVEVVRASPGADADALRRVVLARFAPRPIASPAGASSVPEPPWIARIRRILERATAAAPDAFGGYRLDHVRDATADGAGIAVVAFRRDDDRVVLDVLAGGAGPAYLQAGDYRVCHRAESPIDSPARERLVRMLAGLLARSRAPG